MDDGMAIAIFNTNPIRVLIPIKVEKGMGVICFAVLRKMTTPMTIVGLRIN
jgi:hypothetical protein